MKDITPFCKDNFFYLLHADNKNNYTVVTVVTSKAVTLVTIEIRKECK